MPRVRIVVVGVLVVAAGSLATPAPASELRLDPMRTPARCVDDRAIARTPGGLPVLLGPCGGEDLARPAPPGPSPTAAPGPADCVVPGHDDRCEKWAAPRYDGPWPGSTDYPGFGSFDRHTTVLAHPTKDLVFLGGTSSYTNAGLPDADFVQIAYRASTGQPVWTSVFAGLDELTLAYETSIALSPDGDRLYAIGIAAEPGVYAYQALIAAFETETGRRLWARRAPVGANAVETAMTRLSDGTVRERIYLAGGTSGESPGGEQVPAGGVAALDADDGETVWTSSFAGETADGARFNELVVSPDGSTVYAGGGEHLPSRLVMNFATVAFRTTDGAQLWVSRDVKSQPTNGDNGISDMAITPDGSRVLVSGMDAVRSSTIGVPSTSPLLTIARNAETGEVVWRKSYGGPVAGETHFYFTLFQGMMGISPDGRTAVVTAAINSHNSTGTVAYDVATGAQKWGVESVEQGYVFTNFLGYYPQVMVTNDRAFVSNRRGVGYSQYRTVTTAYGLGDGSLTWTARFGTNQTLFGGNALSRDRKTLFVAATDQVYTVGFPVPNPGLDTRDIVTVAYDA